jgi:hypothetical protein
VHVTLTRVRTSEQPSENATIVGEEMLRWLRDIEGFEGMLLLSRPGSTVGLTFWESREAADRHGVARKSFLERMMAVAEVEIEDRADYDVTFAQVPSLAIGSNAR